MCPYHCILSAYRRHHTTTDFRKEGWMMDNAYWSVEWCRTRHRGEYTFIHPGRFLFYFIFSRVQPSFVFLTFISLVSFLLSFLSPILLLQYLPCKTPEGETKLILSVTSRSDGSINQWEWRFHLSYRDIGPTWQNQYSAVRSRLSDVRSWRTISLHWPSGFGNKPSLKYVMQLRTLKTLIYAFFCVWLPCIIDCCYTKKRGLVC